MGRLDGRVALVTGSASGIGAACALRFAEEGAAIAGFDVEPAPKGDWAEAVRVAPAHHFESVDVTDAAQVDAAVAAVCERLGRVDVLLNAAGIAGGGPVHLLDDEAWRRTLDVNLDGTFRCCRAVLPGMLERGAGSIVNIASVEGLEGGEATSAYAASKGGVVLLTRNMAIDYARKGVRVNAICPGFIETPLLASVFENPGMEEVRGRIEEAHQLGRFGQPREIAHAALFLASDEASFVTGQALAVDGGFTAGHRFGIARMLGLG